MSGSAPMNRVPRVLVVDDDQIVLQTCAFELTRQGYEVRVAKTPHDALRIARQDFPDAILLDLNMPMMNGAGFLYRLREDPALRDAAVAVITGEAMDEETFTELHELGAGVWFKPIWLDEVLTITRILLAKRRVN